MQGYVIRRLLMLLPVWVGVSLFAFALMRVVPGDVATMVLGGEGGRVPKEKIQAVRHELGLDKPLYVQYGTWVWEAARFDFGNSFYTKESVGEQIARRVGPSLQLALMSLSLAALVGVLAGTVSAYWRDTPIDYASRVFSISGLAVPNFWLGIMLSLLLLKVFGWSVPLDYVSLFKDPWGNLQKTIWPALIMGYALAAPLARMTRSSLLEVLRDDYVRTARAKGLGEPRVLFRHALRNSLLPVVTVGGIYLAVLMSGLVIMEDLFNIPGIGRFLIEGLSTRDFPVVQASVLLLATVVVISNLLVDLTYAWLDPRIHYR